jgi:hypothetical protein
MYVNKLTNTPPHCNFFLIPCQVEHFCFPPLSNNNVSPLLSPQASWNPQTQSLFYWAPTPEEQQLMFAQQPQQQSWAAANANADGAAAVESGVTSAESAVQALSLAAPEAASSTLPAAAAAAAAATAASAASAPSTLKFSAKPFQPRAAVAAVAAAAIPDASAATVAASSSSSSSATVVAPAPVATPQGNIRLNEEAADCLDFLEAGCALVRPFSYDGILHVNTLWHLIVDPFLNSIFASRCGSVFSLGIFFERAGRRVLASPLLCGARAAGQVRPVCVRRQVQSCARVRQAAHSKGRAHASRCSGSADVIVDIVIVVVGIIFETCGRIERRCVCGVRCVFQTCFLVQTAC